MQSGKSSLNKTIDRLLDDSVRYRYDINNLQEQISERKLRICEIKQSVRKNLAPVLTELFGSAVLKDLKEALKETNNGWVIFPDRLCFLKKWESQKNGIIVSLCSSYDVHWRDVIKVVLEFLSEKGKVEIEDGGTVIPGEDGGGYAVYRIKK